MESLVPVCPEYEEFLPWFAAVGPDLPPPDYEMPFRLPPGYGAVVVPNLGPGEPRPTFYEPFGGKSYFQGPAFEAEVDVPGRYYAVYWDPYQIGGDHVAVLGNKEIWGFIDIIRALIYTPMIRQGLELHSECPSEHDQESTSVEPWEDYITGANRIELKTNRSRPRQKPRKVGSLVKKNDATLPNRHIYRITLVRQHRLRILPHDVRRLRKRGDVGAAFGL